MRKKLLKISLILASVAGVIAVFRAISGTDALRNIRANLHEGL